MCQEAVCEILNRSLSQPMFLKDMFRNPEKALRQFSLTVEEQRALLTGSVSSIEACAGQTLSPVLRVQFETVMFPSPLRESYLNRLTAEAELSRSLEYEISQPEVELSAVR